jgi:hypothetical protein
MAISTLARRAAGLGVAGALVAGGVVVATPAAYAAETPTSFTYTGKIVDSVTNQPIANDTISVQYIADPVNHKTVTTQATKDGAAPKDDRSNWSGTQTNAQGVFTVEFAAGTAGYPGAGASGSGTFIIVQAGLNQGTLTSLGYASGPVGALVVMTSPMALVYSAASPPPGGTPLTTTAVAASGSVPAGVAVDTSAAGVPVTKFASTGGAPTVSGKAALGSTLTAESGAVTWQSTPAKTGYQWYSNGKAILNATAATYKVGQGDLGKSLTVTATGTIGVTFAGQLLAPYTKESLPSAAVAVPTAKTTTGVTAKSSKKGTLSITVSLKSGSIKLNGVVKVTVGKKSANVTVTNGSGKVTIKGLKKGKVTVKATFAKKGGLLGSSATKKNVSVK